MTNIFAKITDEVIQKDLGKFMGPAALRVLTYGSILFIGFCFLCGGVLNNIIPHPSKWVLFGMPSVFLILWVLFIFVTISIEKIYNKTVSNLNKDVKEKEDSVAQKKEELIKLFTKEYDKKVNELDNERYKVLKESERLNALLAKKLNIKAILQIAKKYRSACDDFGQHHNDEQAVKNRFLKAIEEIRTIQEYLPTQIQESIKNLNENNLPSKNDMQDYSKLIIYWLRDDLKLSYN